MAGHQILGAYYSFYVFSGTDLVGQDGKYWSGIAHPVKYLFGIALGPFEVAESPMQYEIPPLIEERFGKYPIQQFLGFPVKSENLEREPFPERRFDVWHFLSFKSYVGL
ncbi:hypothetical protein GCM10027514_10620 [Azotobacter armeniacus]